MFKTFSKNGLKFVALFLGGLLLRLVPLRAPNVEPILAILMPVGRVYGYIAGFSFGFLSIVFYDLLTHSVGIWTLVTASAYGVVGLGAGYFLKKNNSKLNYLTYSILGTLFFDAATGLTIGPIFYGQSFLSAFSGQIPFTLWHLLGNISLSLVLSPAIANFLNQKQSEKSFFYKFNNLKA